jgi:hypothetical protein
VNPNNKSHQKNRQFPALNPPIIIAVIALVAMAYFFSPNINKTNVETASLPDIVTAIEAGEIKKLTVRGDELIADKTDGSSVLRLPTQS